MLKMENVRKQYQDFELNCSMEVKRGYITGLIGSNGAGKSTAFKAILGLIHTDGGEIQVFCKSVEELTPQDRERVGVVMANAGFSNELRIRDIIPILDHLYHHFDREAFEQMCRRLRIPEDKKIKDFSTGMKRKLQVIIAITHEAEFLVLDEPTAGLDVIARDQILEMLREYVETEGRSILISSHISTDLENLCDDLYMIDDGKIILHEETNVLMDQYALLKMTKEQYHALDKSYILRYKEEPFGYSCLTNERQFYQENYPQIEMEKGNIDDVIKMMVRGEA